MVYQKDGPGRLLRTYSDRILWPPELVEAQRNITAANVRSAGSLACSNTGCGKVIGHPMVYEQENRPAFRIVPGSVHAYRNPPTPEPEVQSDMQDVQPAPDALAEIQPIVEPPVTPQ